eukprot:3904432-Amphidinium_carterae.1
MMRIADAFSESSSESSNYVCGEETFDTCVRFRVFLELNILESGHRARESFAYSPDMCLRSPCLTLTSGRCTFPSHFTRLASVDALKIQRQMTRA